MLAKMQRATAQGQPAKWNFAKVVGGYKVALDCRLGREDREGASDTLTRNQKGSWKIRDGNIVGQIRKAASLGQIL